MYISTQLSSGRGHLDASRAITDSPTETVDWTGERKEALQGLDVNRLGCFNISTIFCKNTSKIKSYKTYFFLPVPLCTAKAKKLHQESIWEMTHLEGIPVYGATCHSLCVQPYYPHRKTTGTGCMSYHSCTETNATEITSTSMFYVKPTLHNLQKVLVTVR